MTETRTLLDAADEYDADFGALLRLLAATGARRGEVCGLRWSDIDLEAGTISIRRSVASVTGGTIVRDTKTHAARRIAVDRDTLAALARHRARLEVLAKMGRMELPPDGFVFTSSFLGGDDYGLLARLRPEVAQRRQLLVGDGHALTADGFPVLPTLDHPHWTVVLAEATPAQLERVRRHFRGPVANPGWAP